MAAYLTITLIALVPLSTIRIETDGHSVLPERHPVRLSDQAINDRFGLDELIHVAVISDNLPTLPEGNDVLPSDSTVLRGIAVAVALGKLEHSDRNRQISIDSLEPAEGSSLSRETDALLSDHFLRGTVVGFGGAGLGVLLPLETGADRLLAIERAQNEAEAVLSGSGHHALVVGEAVAENRLTELIVEELIVAFPLISAIVALCLVVALGDVTLAVISLLGALMSVIWVAGSMAACGTPVYATSAVIPVALIAVGVCDEIHLLKEVARLARAQPGRSTAACVRGAIRILRRPLWLTSVTTAAAFGTLIFSGARSVQAIGAYTALGVLASYAISLGFAPALWVLFSRRSGARPGPLDHVSRYLNGRAKPSATQGRTRHVLVGTAWAGLALVAANARIDDNWLSNFPSSDPYRQVAQHSSTYFASEGRILVELEGNVAGFWGNAENLAALDQFVAALNQQTTAISLPAYVDYIDHLRRAKLGKQAPAISLEQALGAFGTPAGWHLARQLISSDQRATLVQLFMSASSYSKIDGILEVVRTKYTHVWPEGTVRLRIGGNAAISHAVVDASARKQLWALPGSFFVVFLILWTSFRSMRDAFLALVPAAITATGMLALIVISGHKVGIATSTVGPIGVGLTVDFAIHMTARLRRARHRSVAAVRDVISRSSAPILADASVLGLGFLTLLAVPNPALQALGGLISATLVMGACITVWLLPAWIAPAAIIPDLQANSSRALSQEKSSSR